MELYVYIGGRWAMRGSYPDNGAPATMAHIGAAVERNAKSWLDGGYRVKLDDIEITPPTAAHMADVAEQFEMVTTPATPRRYATVGQERMAA